ncbi:hypothetical protein I350_04640 [Cryptococcus amylolentus CBS 6273]|uniref:Zn(2)-C6 fungal-type domain-containing protein n=1 Tax=Cryptococcus amylolentus CBS 6273 TaxID=1296118 RepID=A0A1E3JXQ3_9TREE|nr:hypothetical protein I350_04640 [Cryptococcus amylolentus CBS 6273]
MNPSPAKRPRRTSTPSPEPRQGPSISPSRQLPPIQGTPTLPPPFGGSAGWSARWRGASRRSGAEESPSPKDEEPIAGPSTSGSGSNAGTSAQGSSMVFTRDTGGRAPRSMMACVRCRRQKMKCDGPSSVPCRGCRTAGQQCIFEPRSRPKSISVIPSRPFYPGRPGSPASFYPPGAQPAPPVTSRPMGQEYAFRPSSREQMGPPPGSTMGSVYSGMTSRRSPGPPSIASSANIPPSPYGYQPAPQAPPQVIHPPPFAVPIPQRPVSPTRTSTDARLHALERTLESTLRPLSWVPSALSTLQSSVNDLRAQVAPRRVFTVAESTWDCYRTRVWPLTPWLVGLRDGAGLPGMVADMMGRRAEEVARAGQQGQGTSTIGLEGEARREVGRLIGEGREWAKEEVHGLCVLATWTNDRTYAALAVAEARSLGMHALRRTQDDWREWAYVVIMDTMCHVPDYLEPITRTRLSGPWRDRLGSMPTSDPAIRERDSRLLAWIVYAELLGEVFQYRETPTTGNALEMREERLVGPWSQFGQHWDAWASEFDVRNDPILSLYHMYAVLFTVTPVCFADDRSWEELATSPEGQQLLERGKDAAISLIQSICSTEVGRTLSYSFPLYRPLLALAVLHLISFAAALPAVPAVQTAQSSILHALRQAYETLNLHVPQREALPGPGAGVGLASGTGGAGQGATGGLLGEVAETGRLELGKRWLELSVGRDAWRRIVG